MPIFLYKVKDRHGQVFQGQLEAEDTREVAVKLRAEGYYVTSLATLSEAKNALRSRKRIFPEKVKPRDLLIFSRQFSSLLGAGVNLLTALNLLTEQIENQTLRDVVLELRWDIEAGASFHEALGAHPRIFPPIYRHMVEAGEAGGNLEIAFARLVQHLERDTAIKKKVIGALTYPAIIAGVAVVSIFFLMAFVLPKFMAMFADSGLELPFITKVLMGISHLLSTYWYVFVSVLAGSIIGLHWFQRTPQGKTQIDRFLFKLRIIGPLIQKMTVTRFSRTLATLLDSGLMLLPALEIVERAVDNQVVATALSQARISISKGSSLEKPLVEAGIFPSIVTQMIAVGEETGDLPNMLNQVADFYEHETGYAVENLTAMIEPLIIIIMGFVVGGIVIAILIPMLDMNAAVL